MPGRKPDSDLMRIGLVAQGGTVWEGGREYLRNLALAVSLAENSENHEISLLLDKAAGAADFEMIPAAIRRVAYGSYKTPPTPFFQKLKQRLSQDPKHRWASRHERWLTEELGLEFVYPCNDYSRLSERTRCASWIPDFQHKYLAEFFEAREIETRDAQFSAIAARARAIVFSSEAARSDFQKFYPGSQARQHVLRFRSIPDEEWYSADAEAVRAKYRLPERFFLICNQLWAHKNHKLALSALSHLKEQGVKPPVVLTGPVRDYRNESFIDELLQTIQSLGLHEQVHVLGRVPKVDQMQLVRLSLALVQPSLFEGWSTVVEEARCFGKKMYISNLPANLEQDPAHVQYFDPGDVDALADLLAEGWANLAAGPDPEREAEGRELNGRQAREFGQTFLEIASAR